MKLFISFDDEKFINSNYMQRKLHKCSESTFVVHMFKLGVEAEKNMRLFTNEILRLRKLAEEMRTVLDNNRIEYNFPDWYEACKKEEEVVTKILADLDSTAS